MRLLTQRISGFCAVLALCNFTGSWAFAGCKAQTHEVNRKQVSNLFELRSLVNKLLKSNVPANSILVSFDLDDTLAILVDGKFVPTEGAIEVLQELFNEGVQLILSSAHERFGTTLTKVRKIGIAEFFGLPAQYIVKRTEVKFKDRVTREKVKLQVRSAGKIAAIKDPSVDPISFRQKAIAPRIVLKKNELKNITHLLVIDNSKADLDQYMTDISRFNIVPSGVQTVDLIELKIDSLE